jgi:ribosomal protein L7/L12
MLRGEPGRAAHRPAIGGQRPALLLAVIRLIGMGFEFAGRRRREPAARAARRGAASRDDMPADIIGLVAQRKKVRTIRRYRELTGAGLREAEDVIDSL